VGVLKVEDWRAEWVEDGWRPPSSQKIEERKMKGVL